MSGDGQAPADSVSGSYYCSRERAGERKKGSKEGRKRGRDDCMKERESGEVAWYTGHALGGR